MTAERLDTLIGELGKIGSPIGRYLRPGRTEAEVRAALGALGLDPPAELVDWYATHDGVDYAAVETGLGRATPIEVFFGVTPLSLVGAARLADERRASVRKIFGDEPVPRADLIWRDVWFPILEGLGSIFVVDCSGDGPRETGPSGASCRTLARPKPAWSRRALRHSSTCSRPRSEREVSGGTQTAVRSSRKRTMRSV
ncbi:MAG: hypothetical protein ABI635_02345 [Actinomycetota bacterium]